MAGQSGTSESELRRRVAELIDRGPRYGVAQLVKEFRDAGRAVDEARLKTVVAALCAHNSTWKGEFKKRATGAKKCPPALRQTLGECLRDIAAAASPDAKQTAETVIQRARVAKSKRTVVIDDTRELGWGEEHRDLVAKLHEIAPTPEDVPVDLTIHFRCDQLYVHGLGLLAAWCQRKAAQVRIVVDSDRAKQYLAATGFRRVVEDHVVIKELLFDGQNHVALTSIHRERQDAADRVAGRIVSLFRRHIDLDEPKWNGLATMFAELVENVYRHAQSNAPAFVMAQAFPKTQKLHVVVADTGIGVYNSFRNSDDRAVKADARNEKTAIDMAFQKLVTSKTTRHKGYGLYVVKRLVQLNGGVMRLMSGSTTRSFWTQAGSMRKAKTRDSWTPHRPWQGTEVSLMFNLDRPLPLLDVYRELGPLDGGTDFFQ